MSADALLKSVLANPDDDLPRLVYADWLDENGDPARAEFIRTQIELANLPDHDPRYRQLEDREHELLSEHERAWLGNDVADLHDWEWRRGFLDEIAAVPRRLVTYSRPPLSPRHPVQIVRAIHPPGFVTECDLELSSRPAQPWWETVRTFSAAASSMPIEDVCQFTRFVLCSAERGLSRLRELNLSLLKDLSALARWLRYSPFWRTLGQLESLSYGASQAFDRELLDMAEVAKELGAAPLVTLNAPDSGVTSNGLHALLVQPMRTLRHLDISENPIAPDAYLAFENANPAMRLDKLDVSGTPLAGISLEPLLHARSLEALTRLEMNGCGSARRNMEALARSPFWTQATELRAHSGTIPASTFEPLAQSAGPPALRLLDLADNYLRTEGVRMLCEAPWAGSLTWLALSRNYLDDESCEVLAKSGRFTNLRTLHLAHNHFTQDGADGEQITSRGVMALAEHPSLANLRLLTLSYTGITDAAVDVVVNAPFWRLFGLGIGGCNLSPTAVRMLANSPRLARLNWLDVSHNSRLGGQALRSLSESPYLSPLCELDCGGIAIDDDVRAIFRERLGPRFSH